jgi:hypothetical protein
MPKLDMPSPLMVMPMPTPPIAELATSLSILSTAGESYDIMLIFPEGGTLRGAGEEKALRCFEGVSLSLGVGVAMVGVSASSWLY